VCYEARHPHPPLLSPPSPFPLPCYPLLPHRPYSLYASSLFDFVCAPLCPSLFFSFPFNSLHFPLLLLNSFLLDCPPSLI
jgi:hypothetical protein